MDQSSDNINILTMRFRQVLATVGLDWMDVWWSRGGSNSRPSHCERDALPAELRPRKEGEVSPYKENYNLPAVGKSTSSEFVERAI